MCVHVYIYIYITVEQTNSFKMFFKSKKVLKCWPPGENKIQNKIKISLFFMLVSKRKVSCID